MVDIGENIKKIRELKNLTQEAVAIQLAVSQKTYSNIEKSVNNLTYEKIERIAEILEVSVAQILELDVNVMLNSYNQNGGIQCNTSNSYNYSDEQHIKLYDQLLEEKERIIFNMEKVIEEKDKVIQLLKK